MNENIKKQHTVSLTERSLLTVTAVSEVLGFDEGLVTLDVGDTLLTVSGSDLSVTKLSLETARCA